MDKLREEANSGVSNVEIDWFLRGKLPTDTSPMPTPHRHNAEEQPTDAQQPQALRSPHGMAQSSPAQEKLGHVLSRSRSMGELESSSSSSSRKKGGFFKSLFGKKKTKEEEPEYDQNNHSTHHLSPTKSTPAPIKRSKSLASSGDLDPRLEEFLRYYKAKGLDKLHKDIESANNDHTKDKNINKHTSGSSSLSSSITSSRPSTTPAKPTKVDALGRPIPPHPSKAPLPSALAKHSKFEQHDPLQHPQDPSAGSRLGFLKRHYNSISEGSLTRTSSGHSSVNTTKAPSTPKPPVIPGLDDLPKLKRVSFGMPVFFNDPPQQIPSRTPRKGEVEIMNDGSIIIHKLTPAEKRQMMSQNGGGIVVGGSGHLKIIANQEEPAKDRDKDVVKPPSSKIEFHTIDPNKTTVDEKVAIDGHLDHSDEQQQQHHSIKVAAAEAAAEARGKAGPNELRRIVTNNEDEVTVSSGASKINIDKPMVRHNKSAVSLMTLASEHQQDDDTVFPPRDVKVPLDVLYTRCCHLREILPIPATLKQIKPGTNDPIPLLQLRNPRPSLVEVLTFSDFISVAPVLCISLDGVSLSSEMFRVILSSLVYKKELEKLTLRNTPIDELGWRLLCWFLSKNKSVDRIDLTQVPSLQTNVQKPCKTQMPSSIIRMESDLNSRSDMNWNLLNAAIMSRNGIDELVINGAKMSDEEFQNLIELGVSLSTTKLGLGYNDLTLKQMATLARNLDFTKIVGFDMGYNNLDGKLGPFVEAIKAGRMRESQLKFLSMNSCNLSMEEKEFETLINDFSGFKELRYLDLSNNKRIFPMIMSSLIACLPLYPNLARIHLDYNELSPSSLVTFAELIPLCKSLTYISLLGNTLDNVSAGALTSAVRLSHSVMTLDINYDEISPKFRESIGLYTVRNMQHQIYGGKGTVKDGKELIGLHEELSKLLLSDVGAKDTDPKLIQSVLEKALKIRKSVHETIDELFKLRIQGTLNTEGKETLIRFCFLDSSIEKGLNLLKKRCPVQEFLKKLETDDSFSHHRDVLKETNAKTDSGSSTPMSRQSSVNLVPTSSFVQNNIGHNELMPFGVTDTVADSQEAEEIKDDMKARAADNFKLKEEASMLKASGFFKNPDNSKRDEFHGHLDQIQDMSGDELRKVLMKSDDIDNVYRVIGGSKEKSKLLSELYKKGSDSSSDIQSKGGLDLETLKNTKNNLSERSNFVFSDDEGDDDGNDGVINDKHEDDRSSDSESDTGASGSEIGEKEELNHAYDEILDHLERVRTSTQEEL